jgi:hypothetical protein
MPLFMAGHGQEPLIMERKNAALSALRSAVSDGWRVRSALGTSPDTGTLWATNLSAPSQL